MNTDRYTNSISNNSGDFQGVLYDQTVKAEVLKIGSTIKVGGVIPNPSGPGGSTYYVDDYTYEDWLEHVSTYDMVCLTKHILALQPPQPLANGYDLLAADVNHNGSITTTDVLEIRKLLLGIYQKFPGYDTPWLFVPEFIPQDNAIAFNANPFSMTLNGTSVSSNVYTSKDFQYTIPNSSLDKSGYDGIKIGDVCQPSSNFCDPATIDVSSSMLLVPNNIYQIDVKAAGFNQIEAFQMGIYVDHSQLEVVDIIPSNLPEFTKADNIGLTQLENNQVNMVWLKSNAQSQTLSSSANSLFKIKVKALQPISDLGSVFNINKGKTILPTVFYGLSDCSNLIELAAVVSVVETEDRSDSGNSMLDRYSNLFCYPNPANDHVNIAFESNHDDSALLSISDIQGNEIFSIPAIITKGINTITLDAIQLERLPSGVLSVSLLSGTDLKVGRLVKL